MRSILAILILVSLVTPLSPVFARSRRNSVKAEGETGRKLEQQRSEKRKTTSKYKRWKRRLPFWPRKLYLLLELSIFITIGVFLAQILELSGAVRYLAVLAWPITKLGRLHKETGPAFLMAFQSGAVANSMLVSSRNDGSIDGRELYTSVFIVSCLSLFAHLPTYVVPIGSVFGAEATAALFGVRFAAIVLEIVLVLVVSNFIVRPWLALRRGQGETTTEDPVEAPQIEQRPVKKRKKSDEPFWKRVWKRSRRTLRRLLIYLVPTYVFMACLEYFGFFKWLSEAFPKFFTLSFLPPQAAVIIPAQALSLYNGAIAAANYLDNGQLELKQAVIVILVGSMVTAPIRTLKHALPTYIAVLGPRAGTIMAVSAQALRVAFVAGCTIALWFIW